MYPDNKPLPEELSKEILKDSNLERYLTAIMSEAYFKGRQDMWEEMKEFSIKLDLLEKEKQNGKN